MKQVRGEWRSAFYTVGGGASFAPFPTALLPSLNILPASVFLEKS